jgi:PAS domain-containing protein
VLVLRPRIASARLQRHDDHRGGVPGCHERATSAPGHWPGWKRLATTLETCSWNDFVTHHPFDTRAMPSSDVAFRQVVDRLLGESESPADLLARLRTLYPKADLAERGLEDEPRIFYVYRDGRFELPTAERWWLDEEVARVSISVETGQLVRVNDEWSHLMGDTPQRLVGRHYSDFVLPEARAAVSVLFDTLVTEGTAHSEALLQRPDGSLVAIEFWGVREGDRIHVAYRPLEA